jgi:hypothetical protein
VLEFALQFSEIFEGHFGLTIMTEFEVKAKYLQ